MQQAQLIVWHCVVWQKKVFREVESKGQSPENLQLEFVASLLSKTNAIQ